MRNKKNLPRGSSGKRKTQFKKKREMLKRMRRRKNEKGAELLKENIDYYSIKQWVVVERRELFVVTEEGKAKEEEIKEQGRKEKLRLNCKAEWIFWILQSSANGGRGEYY